MRARSAYVRSDLGEKVSIAAFPFPFLDRDVFPFPSALQGPIQLQLALSVWAHIPIKVDLLRAPRFCVLGRLSSLSLGASTVGRGKVYCLTRL